MKREKNVRMFPVFRRRGGLTFRRPSGLHITRANCQPRLITAVYYIQHNFFFFDSPWRPPFSTIAPEVDRFTRLFDDLEGHFIAGVPAATAEREGREGIGGSK